MSNEAFKDLAEVVQAITATALYTSTTVPLLSSFEMRNILRNLPPNANRAEKRKILKKIHDFENNVLKLLGELEEMNK